MADEGSRASQGAALVVEDLVAGYGGPPIIDGVSIRARRGETTAVVGPNGAGKSTLLKAVAGLIRPTAGSARLFGRDPLAEGAKALAGVAGFVE